MNGLIEIYLASVALRIGIMLLLVGAITNLLTLMAMAVLCMAAGAAASWLLWSHRADPRHPHASPKAIALFARCWNGTPEDQAAAWFRASVSAAADGDYDLARMCHENHLRLRLSQAKSRTTSQTLVSPSGRLVNRTETIRYLRGA